MLGENLKNLPKPAKEIEARKISGIASETVQLSPVWPFASNEYSEEIDGIIFCIRLGEKTGRFERSEYHGVSF